MFTPIKIPFGAKMLFNIVKLKNGVSMEDAELAMGEMCNVVKNTYRTDGFIAGQVFKFSGFISEEGSVNTVDHTSPDDHLVIVTYWESFAQHEKSHADKIFKEKFSALAALCDETVEMGYDMLWQGEPEQ